MTSSVFFFCFFLKLNSSVCSYHFNIFTLKSYFKNQNINYTYFSLLIINCTDFIIILFTFNTISQIDVVNKKYKHFNYFNICENIKIILFNNRRVFYSLA